MGDVCPSEVCDVARCDRRLSSAYWLAVIAAVCFVLAFQTLNVDKAATVFFLLVPLASVGSIIAVVHGIIRPRSTARHLFLPPLLASVAMSVGLALLWVFNDMIESVF